MHNQLVGRNRSAKFIAPLVVTMVIFAANTSVAATAPSVGKVCSKVGAKSVVNGKKLICTRVGKKLVWALNTVKVLPPSVPAPTMTPTPTPATSATSVPVPTPTSSEIPTSSPEPSVTPTPTNSLVEVPGPIPSSSPSDLISVTPAPVESATAVPTPTDAPTITNTPSPTPVPTSTNLITPVAAPSLPALPLATQFSFEKVYDDGYPVHWNTCNRITWTLFQSSTTKDYLTPTKKALQILANFTGFTFEYIPNQGLPHPTYDQIKNNSESKPIANMQIIYAPGTELPYLDATHFGWTRTYWSYTPQSGKQVKGLFKVAYIMMHDEPSFNWFNMVNDMGFNGITLDLMHELGHAVGLQHVTDTSQLMFPNRSTNYPSTFNLGDAYGLYKVGAGIPCGS
jgi:hypothetical protein